jgi:hypothetical protein
MEMEGDEMSELNVTPGEWANAHLMAASKELYEALARMVKLFAYCDCHHADCTECEKFEFANAALAKARGEAGDE